MPIRPTWCTAPVSRSSRPKTRPSCSASSACRRRAAWKTIASRSTSAPKVPTPACGSPPSRPARRPRVAGRAGRRPGRRAAARRRSPAAGRWRRSPCSCSPGWYGGRLQPPAAVPGAVPVRRDAARQVGCQTYPCAAPVPTAARPPGGSPSPPALRWVHDMDDLRRERIHGRAGGPACGESWRATGAGRAQWCRRPRPGDGAGPRRDRGGPGGRRRPAGRAGRRRRRRTLCRAVQPHRGAHGRRLPCHGDPLPRRDG